jgi:hypothetical protein
MPVQKNISPDVIRCPYTHCNAVYSYWSARERMYCPVCRQIFTPGNDVTLTRAERSDYMPSNVIKTNNSH